jgi:tetratricopeptide (TPR) repeat protein
MRIASHHSTCIAILTLATWPALGVYSADANEKAAYPAGGTASRWPSGPAAGGTLIHDNTQDAEVKKASWSAPDQPRTATPNTNRRGNGAAAAGANKAGTSSPGFRGFRLKSPTMPFTKAKTPAPQVAAQQPANRPSSSHMPTAAPSAAGGQDRAQMVRRPQNVTASGSGASAPPAGSTQAARPATTTHSQPGVATSTQTSSQPSAAASSAAERLLLSAHQASVTADTEIELTQVVETCRRARVSQATPTIAGYANELAAWAMNRRGQLKADAGRTKEALLDFDEATRLDGNCWRAIHNRGVLLAQQGDFEKAFDDFNRTIELNPEFAKAYSNRAALFVVASDLEPALADYSDAIKLDPNLAVAHRGRGRVCHLLGELGEAIDHYDAAVQLSPNDGYAVACRADLLTDMGRYNEALRQYEHAIQIDPRSSQAQRGLAWLLATCPDETIRDPSTAIKRAEMAIRLEEQEDSLAFDTLAAAHASNGDFGAAMKTLGHAISIAPENERDAYQNRLLMYQHQRPFRIAPMQPVAQASYAGQ